MTRYIGAAEAEAHEALVLRLLRLLGQVERVAVRRPGTLVSPALLQIAGDILHDCRGLTGGGRGPAPASDYAGLAAQLGQALAALDMLEAQHTLWDAERRAFVWSLGPTESIPVRRLRQEVARRVPARESRVMRDKLDRMLKARDEASFDRGVAAGRAEREG